MTEDPGLKEKIIAAFGKDSYWNPVNLTVLFS